MSRPTSSSTPAGPAQPVDVVKPPNFALVVLRSIGSVGGGVIAASLVVIVLQMLLLVLPLWIRNPQAVPKLFASLSDPAKMKQLMESEEIPQPGTFGLAISLVIDFV